MDISKNQYRSTRGKTGIITKNSLSKDKKKVTQISLCIQGLDGSKHYDVYNRNGHCAQAHYRRLLPRNGSFDANSHSIHIRTVSVCFAELVETSLWVLWEEQHLLHTWFLQKPAREVSKKLKSSIKALLSNLYTVQTAHHKFLVVADISQKYDKGI